jgi:hypothetical protein
MKPQLNLVSVIFASIFKPILLYIQKTKTGHKKLENETLRNVYSSLEDNNEMFIFEKDQQDAHVCICWSFSRMCITMYRVENVNFDSAQQAKQIYRYKNTKERLHKSKTAV